MARYDRRRGEEKTRLGKRQDKARPDKTRPPQDKATTRPDKARQNKTSLV